MGGRWQAAGKLTPKTEAETTKHRSGFSHDWKDSKIRGFKADGLKFIIDHATEDEKHAILIRNLICEVVTRYPETEAAMIRCFDYFRQVYPLPVWTEAYQRSIQVKPTWEGDLPWALSERRPMDFPAFSSSRQ